LVTKLDQRPGQLADDDPNRDPVSRIAPLRVSGKPTDEGPYELGIRFVEPVQQGTQAPHALTVKAAS
jgi:hypothetical protein